MQDRSSLHQVWEAKYRRRRVSQAYETECVPIEGSLKSGESLTTKFLCKGRTRLHPPDKSLFLKLREFLGTSTLNRLRTNSGFIILDDRRDPNCGSDTMRTWDSDTYRLYPPEGHDIRTEKLNLVQFLDLLRKKVSICISMSFDVD